MEKEDTRASNAFDIPSSAWKEAVAKCAEGGHERIEGEYDGHILPYCNKCKTDLPLT